MADRPRGVAADRTPGVVADWTPSLATVAIATFDTVAFVLILVVAAHATGSLADVLASLDTAIGVVIFVYLWVVVVLGIQWALAPISLAESRIRTVVARGVSGGGLVGAAFLLGIVLVAATPLVVTGDLPPYSLLLIVLIGAAISIAVGALVGLLASLLDVALYRLAGRLLPASATDHDRL